MCVCVCVCVRGQRQLFSKNYLLNLEKLAKFIVKVKVMREAHKISDNLMINVDETPLYFNMPRSRTVSRKGVREVRIRSTGAEKRRLTVILACTAPGIILPPMIIFKGRRAFKNIIRVVVTVQSKGWNDASISHKDMDTEDSSRYNNISMYLCISACIDLASVSF